MYRVLQVGISTQTCRSDPSRDVVHALPFPVDCGNQAVRLRERDGANSFHYHSPSLDSNDLFCSDR
jgi:hypothetical protein